MNPRLFPFAVAAAAIIAGCKKHASGDGHEHAAKPPSGAQSDGHDHGHEHGGGEHADEVTLSTQSVERYGVKVQTAQLWALRPTIAAPARVAFNAEATAHVGSPLRGRAIELKVRLGDSVKRGDPMIIVESPELGEAQAEYFQRRLAAQGSAPAVDVAKTSWDRARSLYEQSQGIALAEVQKREAEYKLAAAAQQSADLATVAAKNRLRLLGMSASAVDDLARAGSIDPRHTIAAPIDGQVVQREITLGETVNPDREALLVLADTSILWVLAQVPESRLPELAVGATAWVTASAPPGAEAGTYEGRIALLSPQIDAATRTIEVRIEVPATVLPVRPGMFVQVELVAASPDAADAPPVVAVPDQAVQTVEGGPAVFVPVKGEPNTFAKRAVTVGKPVGGLVPILAGLSEGEEFVAAGSFILKAELGKGSAAHEH